MDMCNTAAGAKTGRISAVDVARGIGIMLIVLSHVNYTPGVLTYIYSFHVPLFFILSGLLFRPGRHDSFGAFARSRLQRLLCPYVFFYLASFLLTILTTLVSAGPAGLAEAALDKIFLQMFLSTDRTYFPNNPLWFVLCLLCVELIYYPIARLKPWQNLTVSALLTVLGWLVKSGLLPFWLGPLPWSLDIVPFAMGFYALGHLLSGRVLQGLDRCRGSKRGKLLSAAAAAICFAAVLPLAVVNGKVSVGSGIYENGLLLYATSILGALGTLFAGAALENCLFLRFLGKNTLPIMGTHYVIRNLYNAACSVLGLPIYDVRSIARSVIPYIVILTASIICTVIYNKLRPHFR